MSMCNAVCVARSMRFTEKRLLDEEHRPRLRLKSGSEVPAELAYWHWLAICSYRKESPQGMLNAYKLAQGDKIPVKQLHKLQRRQRGWFDESGQLNSLVRDVILSSHEDDPAGVANPFRLATAAEREVFQSVKQVVSRFFDQITGRGDEPSGHSIR